MADEEIAELAEQAYVFGFPLVFNLDQVRRYVTAGVGANPRAPFNTFSHARSLAGPEDTFVSINNDTVYSMAQLDLSVGPVRLRVPDTAGRYYVLQFVDAWTNNFAYVGHRATGTRAGEYLLVPPDWTGEAATETTVIRFPTRVASIVGRWACTGAEDLRAVHQLQGAITLTQLDDTAQPTGLPDVDPDVPEALVFLEKLRVASQVFPPAERDREQLAGFAALGLAETGTVSPYRNHAHSDALVAGLRQGKETLDRAVYTGAAATNPVNGWRLSVHGFDYNLDFFEVGARDDPEFKLIDPHRRILGRAAAAQAGLWGNHGYEAAYAVSYVDSDGDQLTGARSYTMRLQQLPPVEAFWSLTMYSMPDFYLVANQIDRYSIGDRTPGIVYADDGSLTITISHARPDDPTAAANWLPAPAGEFRPALRMYEPHAAILDGDYVIPAIEKATP